MALGKLGEKEAAGIVSAEAQPQTAEYTVAVLGRIALEEDSDEHCP